MNGFALLIQSTPSYYWLLPGTIGLLARYARDLLPHIYIPTEIPDHPVIQWLRETYNVQTLPMTDTDFLESRLAGARALPSSVSLILPIQEDFLLERPGVNLAALRDLLQMFATSPTLLTARLMPCPGPRATVGGDPDWATLKGSDMLVSYQATVWRRDVYERFFERLLTYVAANCKAAKGSRAYNRYAIDVNPAETDVGQTLIQTLYPEGYHLGWRRAGPWSNAVYMCPFPYRPTAIVKGVFQPFAKELLEREGFWATCERFRTET